MASELIYKLLQFFLLVIFVIFISDIRKKKGMAPLVHKTYINILKIAYLIPIFIYAYVLFSLKNVSLTDYIGLFFTILGTFIVAKGKIDLGKFHTWAGYRLKKTQIFTKGIYGYVRHPIYTGIFIFISGAFLVMFSRLSILLLIPILITLIYAAIILIIVANKESKILMKEHRKEFINYMKKVHPFLPIKGFKK